VKNIENQRGYALLIVMLTIIIFLSLSAVFMSASINHSNQEQTVDKNNQAVVAAEMGVKKIHNQLRNDFLRNTPTYLDFASNEIRKFNDTVNAGQKNLNNLDSEINAIKKEISLNMAKEINLELSSRCGLTGSMLSDSEFRSKYESNAEFYIVSIECKKISDNSPMNNEIISIETNTSNILKNYSIQSVDKNLVVTGIINGISRESNNELAFSLEYPISDLAVSDNRAVFLNQGNTNTTEFIPPNFDNLFKDFINKPYCTGDIANKQCVATNTTDLSKLNNSKLLFKSANNINSSWMSDLKKSMIFSETNIELDNVNGMKNGSIIVNGNLVTGQFKGINNMYIQANGNMEIQKMRILKV
jgi:type II secretory pathway pseudopilin PulG